MVIIEPVPDRTGPLCTCQKKWGPTDNEMRDSGRHPENVTYRQLRPLTKFDGGLQRLHTADKAAVDWLRLFGT